MSLIASDGDDLTNREIYSYLPLEDSKRQVRLVRIDHGSDEETRCELAHFSLDDKPPYTALSYRWTARKADCQIVLNSCAFSLRPDLYAYLKLRLRERDYSWIFIDAICINQEDLTEKANQIGLMGDIFWMADQVIAWINPNVIEDVEETLLRDYCAGQVEYDELPQAHKDSVFLGMLLTFVEWDFWSRLWIVQELFLARNLTLRSGQFQVNAERLLRIIRLVYPMDADPRGKGAFDQFRKPNLSLEHQRHVYLRAAANILSTRSDMQRDTQERPRLPLLDAMTLFVSQDCSIRHDRVFGLLGITSIHSEPDYHMSVLKLYLRVLNEGLYAGPNLDEGELALLQRGSHESLDDYAKMRLMTELFQFSILLRTALGLPIDNIVILLLTDETFRLWGLQSRLTSNMEGFEQVFTLDCSWASVKAFLKWQRARHVLRKWQRTDAVVYAPPSQVAEADGSTYTAWTKFATDVYHDIQERMANDANISKSFKGWLEHQMGSDHSEYIYGYRTALALAPWTLLRKLAPVSDRPSSLYAMQSTM